jgi:hypothetical protein
MLCTGNKLLYFIYFYLYSQHRNKYCCISCNSFWKCGVTRSLNFRIFLWMWKFYFHIEYVHSAIKPPFKCSLDIIGYKTKEIYTEIVNLIVETGYWMKENLKPLNIRILLIFTAKSNGTVCWLRKVIVCHSALFTHTLEWISHQFLRRNQLKSILSPPFANELK